VNLSLTGVPL